MKNSALKVVILAGSTVLLAACNNGGGGGDPAVKLETEGDALRELGLSTGNGLMSQYINFPSGAATARSKALGAKAVNPANCNTVKGTESYQEGVKDRDFKLLSPAATGVRVEFSGQTNDNFQEQYCDGEGEEISVTLRQAGGASENGSGESEAGAYSYSTYGSGDEPAFELMEEYFNNELTYRQFTEQLGTAERFDSGETSVYGLLLRAKSEYFQQDGQDAKVSFGFGDGNEPLRATVDNDSFQLDGSYHYSTNLGTCSGGKVRVSTPSEEGITVGEPGLTSGELRLSSGRSTASFTFNNDGGATLVINGGASIALSPEQVQQARQNVAAECAEESSGDS